MYCLFLIFHCLLQESLLERNRIVYGRGHNFYEPFIKNIRIDGYLKRSNQIIYIVIRDEYWAIFTIFKNQLNYFNKTKNLIFYLSCSNSSIGPTFKQLEQAAHQLCRLYNAKQINEIYMTWPNKYKIKNIKRILFFFIYNKNQ